MKEMNTKMSAISKHLLLAVAMCSTNLLWSQSVSISYDDNGNSTGYIVIDNLPFFHVSADTVLIEDSQNSFGFLVTVVGSPDLVWLATEESDWLQIVKNDIGIGTDSVLVQAEPNPDRTVRFAKLTVSSEGATNEPVDVIFEQIGVNEAPRVENPIPDITLETGFGLHEIDVADVFIDPEGDPFELSFTVDWEARSLVRMEGSIVTLYDVDPPTEYGVSIIATDSLGAVGADSFRVSVISTENISPRLTEKVPGQVLPRDFDPVSINLSRHFYDPENDPITYVLDKVENPQFDVEINGTILKLSRANNKIVDAGESHIFIYAMDDNLAKFFTFFKVTIEDVLGMGNQKTVTFYPNPTSSVVTLEIDPGDRNGNLQLWIFNNAGKRITSQKLSDERPIIDLSELPDGSYHLLIIRDRTMIGHGKVILRK